MPSAVKRPRPNDDDDSVSVRSSLSNTTEAVSKPNGVANRSPASLNLVNNNPSSLSRPSAGFSMKRAQRSHKMLLPQPGTTKPRRPSPLSHRGPLSNAPVRSMSPGMMALRPPPPMSTSLTGSNPNQGGLMMLSSNPFSSGGLRMPGQSGSQAQRHPGPSTPGMLGNGPNVANFLGMQSSGGGGGSGMHSNRSSMAPTGGGPIMGGVGGGFGMRFWGPGGGGIFADCRQCGMNNPPGSNCCRQCRTPLR